MSKNGTDKLCEKILASIGADSEVHDSLLNEVGVWIPPSRLGEVVNLLMTEFGFFHLTAITVQVNQHNHEIIEVMYHFWQKRGITICTKINKDNLTLSSIIDQIPGADFYEREAAEMFGVNFSGRTSTPSLFLPDDWQGAPPMLRKEDINGED